MLSIITEQPIIEPPTSVKVLSDDKDKIVEFTALIQTMDEVNQNKRLYEKSVLLPQIEEYIHEMVEPGNAVGELDHPPLGSDDEQVVRQLTVKYGEVSHKFLKIWVEGNNVFAQIRTTRTAKGNDLAGLILDGVRVGFSLRAWGKLEDMYKNGEQIKRVTAPVKIMCWDAVCNPSHKTARLYENSVISIEDENIIFHSQMALTESTTKSNDISYMNELVNDYKKNYLIKEAIDNSINRFLV